MTVLVLALLVSQWMYQPHWSKFLVSAGPLIVIYPVTMVRIQRSSRRHLMRSPDDGRR